MIQQSDWPSTLIMLIYIFRRTALFTCRKLSMPVQLRHAFGFLHCTYCTYFILMLYVLCIYLYKYLRIWSLKIFDCTAVWSNLFLFFRCLTYVREAAQRAATKSELHKTQIESLLGEKVDTTVWTIMLGWCWAGRRGHCFNKIPCQASSVHFMICQEFSGNWQPWNGEQVVILHRQVYQN